MRKYDPEWMFAEKPGDFGPKKAFDFRTYLLHDLLIENLGVRRR